MKKLLLLVALSGCAQNIPPPPEPLPHWPTERTEALAVPGWKQAMCEVWNYTEGYPSALDTLALEELQWWGEQTACAPGLQPSPAGCLQLVAFTLGGEEYIYGRRVSDGMLLPMWWPGQRWIRAWPLLPEATDAR